MKCNGAGFVLNSEQECEEALCELKGRLCTVVCTCPSFLLTSQTEPRVLAAGADLLDG